MKAVLAVVVVTDKVVLVGRGPSVEDLTIVDVVES
jgi:hypothetical protein